MFLARAARPFCRLAKFGGCYKDPTNRTFIVKGSLKSLNFLRTNPAFSVITLRLNVYRIKAKRVPMNNAVDSFVAPAASVKCRFFSSAAIAHCEEKTNNEPFEEYNTTTHRLNLQNPF